MSMGSRIKNWYRTLGVNYKTAFWNAIIIMIATLFTLPLLLRGQYEYSLSLLLAGAIASLSYLCFGLCDHFEEKKTARTITMVILFLKLFLVLILGIVFGYLYYRNHLHLFEPFTFLGGYFVSIIVLVTMSVIDLFKGRKREC